MQKTKLGISVGLLGAALFFACFFGGYTAAILLAGYILLCEDNAWLKQTAVKGLVLMFGFAVLSAVIYLIPNAIDLIDSLFNVFGGYFHLTIISNLINVVNSVLNILQKVLFIALGLKALNQGSIAIPVVDAFVSKYMN